MNRRFFRSMTKMLVDFFQTKGIEEEEEEKVVGEERIGE